MYHFIVDQDIRVQTHKHLKTGGEEIAVRKNIRDDTAGLRIETRPLDEIYDIDQDLIGKGASGQVYRARRLKDNELVAIKVVPKTEDDNRMREIELTQMVQCTAKSESTYCAIIPIYDAWMGGEDGTTLFIEMKLIQGGDGYALKEREIAIPDEWSNLLNYWEFIYSNLISLADTLGHIHKQCVLHRDIKPENLLFESETQRLYFADFGLACKFPIQCDGFSGSYSYVDPLTVIGKRQIPVNNASDVYSLGLSMYEILTRTQYPIERDKFSTGVRLRRAYNEALRVLEKLTRYDNTGQYRVMFKVLGLMFAPFDKRPTLESIVTALKENDISKLEFTSAPKNCFR
jgi:serine/threonine protein kinase